MAERFDVAVVGGGPAGATAATLIARRGHRVLLLERATGLRYQIGESLLPATVHGVCRLLGITERLEEAGFTRKRGGSFRWGSNPAPWTFAFELAPELAAETGYAYQVRRAEFDQILLDTARATGVDVRRGATAGDIVTTEGRVTGLTYTDATGQARPVVATYVLDASGNTSRLHRTVGSRQYDEHFRNVAVFGYFAGGRRLPAPDAGNILCAAFDEGWIWYIPLADDLTSVGAVVHRDQAHRISANPDEALHHYISRCDIVAGYLADTPRVTTGLYSPTRVRTDYSYTTDRLYRPGMALIGDAAGFIDPVFSTGVHLATYSALLAARSINTTLDHPDQHDAAWREFDGRYRREYGLLRQFLISFYDMNRTADSYFWDAHRILDDHNTNLESFVRLVGGVASGENALTGHVPTTGSPVPTEQIAEYQFATPTAGAVMNEMVSTARQANRIDLPGTQGPLLDQGLVPSPDLLAWTRPA